MKNKYLIFSICTENYKDALDFTLPSWIKQDAVGKIVIYTDFDYDTIKSNKLEIINTLKKTDDWLEIVGLKAIQLKEFLETYNPRHFVFLDVDCYILKDVSEVFSQDFDIAATRMNKKKPANSGVWFVKNTDKIKRFADDWILKQDEYKKNGWGIKKHRSSYEQNSFSDILHKEHKNKTYFNVLPISEGTYNYEDDNMDRWINNVNKHKPKILHFKGRRWRDKNSLLIFDKINY